MDGISSIWQCVGCGELASRIIREKMILLYSRNM